MSARQLSEDSQRQSWEEICRRGILVVVVGIGLTLWFWLDLWLGGGLIGGDVYTYYFPQKSFYADSLQQGLIPFWNPLVGHGYPVVGESQTAVFYPANLLLYRFFDLNTAYNINHLLHYIAAFVAMVLLARELGLSLSGGLLAGLVFVYGWFAPRCCLEWAIITGAYLPLSLWLLLRYFRTGNGLWLWGLSLCLTLQLLAGHYNLAFITLLLLAGWMVFQWGTQQWQQFRSRKTAATPTASTQSEEQGATAPQISVTSSFSAPSQHESRGRGWKSTLLWPGLAITAGVLMASLQLIPTWALKQESQRQTNSSDDFQPGYGHLPPVYLSQCVIPWVWYGEGTALSDRLNQPHWLSISAATNPVEAHLYFGLIPLALAVWAGLGLWKRRAEPESRPFWWLALLGLFGVWYATGWLLPLLGEWPGFSYFRGPGRFGILASLAVALWAGRGLDDCLSLRWTRSSAVLRTGLVWGVIFVSILDFSWVSQRITYAFMVPETPLTERDESLLRREWSEAIPPLRLLAPGPNLPTTTGIAATPVYLGIGPAEYFDPALTYPSEEQVNPNTQTFSPAQVDWLQRAGVTHVLGFQPPDPQQTDIELIWSGVDPFLNRAWGRSEPLYLSQVHGSRGRAAWATREQAAEKSLEWQHYSPHLVELIAKTPQPETLILTDLFDPDWQVTVDGQPAESLRIEGMYRGVEIPAGQHRVRWEYHPTSVQVGLWVSLAVFTIWLGTLFFVWRQNRIS